VSAQAATRARDERSRLARARVRFAGFELDLIERTLIAPGGGIAQLPGLEFALLKVFLSHPWRPLRRVEMSRMLTRRGDVPLSGRSVDSYVSRLRRRLRRGGAASLIATWPRIGYSFDADIVRTRMAHGA
jgi:DNA-binding response OmpR family regulator